MQYATFYIDNALYGIPILTVREISRFFTITPIQGADERIEGLLNLRGQIVTVLNLGRCLGAAPVPLSAKSRIIILKTEEDLCPEAISASFTTSPDTLALLVSRIGDVVAADDSSIEAAPPHLSGTYVSGVIQHGRELLTLLSTEWLCSLEENDNMQMAGNV
ncbi:MAG: chemotaxis protein CheW [Thermodesulfobacteriota bacterium]